MQKNNHSFNVDHSVPPPLPASSLPPPLPGSLSCAVPDFRLEAIRCLKSAGKSFDEYELDLKIEDLRAEYLKSEGSRRETKRSFLRAKEEAEQESSSLKLREDEEKENRRQRVFVIVFVIVSVLLAVYFSSHKEGL
jgi:predicted nucleic acid-binding Zn ribbon protein